MRLQPLIVLAAVACAACAPDLRKDFPFDGELPDGTYLTVTPQDDGSSLLVVDAQNKSSYVYLDLDSLQELKAAEALETNAWDLSFQRFKVPSNGGGGGTGTVAVAVLKGPQDAWDQRFGELTRAPADGYQQDASDPVFNGPYGGWYYYDLGVHRLFPNQELLYVVRTTLGAHFKVQMLSYYDDNGTAARLKLKVARLLDP